MTAGAFIGVARLVWSRYRVTIILWALFYVALFAASQAFTPQQTRPYWEPFLAVLRMTPFLMPLAWCVSTLSVFTLDLASPESRYPRHLLSLPISAQQLVLPYMIGALLLAALLWAAGYAISDGRLLLSGPLDWPRERLRVDLWSPFLFASLIAWIQALAWMSFRRRRGRVWALFAATFVHAGLLVLLASQRLPDVAGIALSVASMVVSYAVATWGVARARRGDPPLAEDDPYKARRGTRSRRPGLPFTSPLAAQTWFEWQAHGARNRSPFLLLVPLVLALSLAGSFAGRLSAGEAPSLDELVALAGGSAFSTLTVLGFIGILSGPTMASFESTIRWNKSDAYAMPSFFAALPLSTGDFAWAKMKAAAKGMTVLFALTVACFVPVSAFFGLFPVYARVFDALTEHYGALDAAVRLAFVPLTVALVIITTTANVVWTALFGRGWNIAGTVLMIFTVVLLLGGVWAQRHPQWMTGPLAMLAASLPWLAATKLGVLAWLAHLVTSRQHYARSRVALIGACWTVAVAAVLAMSARVLPAGAMSSATLVSAIILAMPVLGILGAPLALQYNRSR